TRYKWALLMTLFAFHMAAGIYVAIRGRGVPIRVRLPALPPMRMPLRVISGLALLLLPVAVFLIARQDFFGRGLDAFFRLLWLFWLLALIQGAGLRLIVNTTWPRAMAATLLLDGLATQLFNLSTAVSAYPFSIGWSEASRYYYGSLVFSRALYGERLPLSVMHGTRYILQSIPFLAGPGTLWAARLWQVVLWIGLTSFASWAVVRRLRIEDRTNRLFMIGWFFLFFFQGAVYYHLQVCVILVMIGISTTNTRRSLATVVVASLWAGMSRVNWFPVPAMLAMALYLLERPYTAARGFWEYVRVPILWGIAGLLSAFAGQAIYIWISGNTNLDAFASSFTSALLWYRWWPSPTNAIGIIPGVLIVSAPVLGIIGWRLHVEPEGLSWLRRIGIAALLLILLAAGLVVSTKIGGGGDLHNMDSYFVLLGCLGAYSLTGRAVAESPGKKDVPTAPLSILALILLVPVSFSLLRLGNPYTYDRVSATADLTRLGQEVATYGREGEVLFMYERHLQAFAMVPPVKMVPEYEVVTLMEMAISGNARYLSKFYVDLQKHRFAAIVAHPQNLGVETGDFIEENNAWNQYVGQPLLCQYKPALTLEYSKVQILVPRERPCPDFPPPLPPK
ncbi:MAG TPA: hypothetical protein VFH29_02970, partial [Anaerolineales bacterium]|nr:hypothetical protein [Anaerolineales bacterium]